MPPAPSAPTISYDPRRVPAAIDMKSRGRFCHGTLGAFADSPYIVPRDTRVLEESQRWGGGMSFADDHGRLGSRSARSGYRSGFQEHAEARPNDQARSLRSLGRARVLVRGHRTEEHSHLPTSCRRPALRTAARILAGGR